MENKIATMINKNALKIDQFFIMHPFSSHDNTIYREALADIDFICELFVENNKTYERLSTLCNIMDNSNKNLLVITGYRGCGKTNFVRFVMNLAEKHHGLVPMAEACEEELHMVNDVDLRKTINDSYEESKKKIITTFFEVKDSIQDSIETQQFVEFLENKVTSKVEYINFDEITLHSSRPVDEALYYRLRRKIAQRLKDGTYYQIIEIINKYVHENEWTIQEGFEEIDYTSFKTFWNSVKELLCLISTDDDIQVLLDEIKHLKLEQILFAFTLFDYAEMIAIGQNSKEQKLLYILDNIDIISDDPSDAFQKSMAGVWKYLWDSRNVFNKIREEKQNDPFGMLFKNTNIIVVMRETTAMHITGHLRDKMRSVMEHFDMSPDINKKLIIQKRINLAQRLIDSKQINNSNFQMAIELLNDLTSNDGLMENLFKLFNNDYRTTVRCLVTILKENLEEIKKAKKILDSENPIVVNGGKGIIFRLLFEGFYDWGYFDGMGIPSRRSIEGKTLLKNHEMKYSITRVILTVLIKRQVKVPERFFVNPEESVKFSELCELVSPLIDLEDIIIIVDKLYSLSNKRFWNHLVTFDNIFHYSPDIIKKYIEEKSKGICKEDIYIRPTTAGQMFVELISPHFEFFACRFSSIKKYSLFHFDNIDDDNQVKSIKTLINDVYNSVVKCLTNLEDYNLAILRLEAGALKYQDIVGSPYYFQSQFHEERIIHTHITYLESYRQFISENKTYSKNYKDLNLFLLDKMKDYLNLLKYDPNGGLKEYRDLYISENSKRLYNELSVCIEKIKENEKLSHVISVTRDHYLSHYRGIICKEMQNTDV